MITAQILQKNFKPQKTPRKIKMAFVSTWLPTQCGIAKFTYSLSTAIAEIDRSKSHIIRMVVPDDLKPREKNVLPVQKQVRESYLAAADFVNRSDIDVVNIQHEYGIFGGSWGAYILDFMKRVRKPIVTVLHTLDPNLPDDGRKVLRQIVQLSRKVIIITPMTQRTLRQRYGIDDHRKVVFIPHGVPRVDETAKADAKKKLGLQGKHVIVSFGLISSGKGFEYAIEALPEVVRRHRNVVYLIVGKTHPNVRKVEGDAYLDMLKRRVMELGLQKHVRFIEEFFLSEKDLSDVIVAGDIFVAPHRAKNQISSGTLMYAMAHKMCVITTPFTQAKREISGRTGFLVKHDDSKMIAKAVNRLLDNPRKLRVMQENAYNHVRDRQWPKIAARYLEVFRGVASQHRHSETCFSTEL